jgi:hypothetical protein
MGCQRMPDGTAKPPVTVIYSKDLLTHAQPRSGSGPRPRCVADSWDSHKLERARMDARKARALSASFSFNGTGHGPTGSQPHQASGMRMITTCQPQRTPARPWEYRLDVGKFDVCCNSATVSGRHLVTMPPVLSPYKYRSRGLPYGSAL